MKLIICSFSLMFVVSATAAVSAQTTTIDFNNDKIGEAPSGFSTALTGRGTPGKWVVMKDDASLDRGNVLAQTDADRTDYRFPVCVYDGLSAKDVDVTVKFKPVSAKAIRVLASSGATRTRTTITYFAPTLWKAT